MKKLSVILAMLVILFPLTIQAVTRSDNPDEIAAIRTLALNLPQVQQDFYQMGEGLHPDQYSYVDLDNDGQPEIWVLTKDLQHYMFYKNKGASLVRYTLPKNYIKAENYENMGWDHIDNVGLYLDAKTDPTMKEYPVFAKTNMVQNEFRATSPQALSQPAHYNRMIFKPHVGKIRYTGVHDNNTYIYSLLEHSFIKKMFRGYHDSEITTVMVNQSFLATHKLMDYTRWKHGEKIQRLDSSSGWIQEIENRYSGLQIESTQWVATLPTEAGYNDFYMVIFRPDKKGYQRAALLRMAEGCIDASWEEFGWDHGGSGTWYCEDQNDYMNHWPSIVAITWNDDVGFEYYVCQPTAESEVVFVLRQLGDQFVRVMEYQIMENDD